MHVLFGVTSKYIKGTAIFKGISGWQLHKNIVNGDYDLGLIKEHPPDS